MKKLLLSTVLIAISLQAKLYAQNDYNSNLVKRMSRNKTEQTFNAYEGMIQVRDFVVLKEGRLILEMSQQQDYESFRNLDSILQNFRKDIAFYKDSLEANPTGSVRIDYALNEEYPFKKIRFKKYNADGSTFLNQGGEISKLKFEPDTVRIIIQKSIPGLGRSKNGPCTIPYSIQATFILGNYYDIDKVIADNVLKGIVDTLEKTTMPKKPKKINRPEYYYFEHPTSVVYNPYYSGKGSLRRTEKLMNNEYDVNSFDHKSRFFSVNADMGVGLVRNTTVPMADIGIQYNKYSGLNKIDHNIFRLSVTPYCFFDKNAEGGGYTMNDNWFINADIGSIYQHDMSTIWPGKECTFGVGYLVVQKGDYFKNTTMKVFTDLQVNSWITIVPEFIFTDNFKQIFPGVTLKVF